MKKKVFYLLLVIILIGACTTKLTTNKNNEVITLTTPPSEEVNNDQLELSNHTETITLEHLNTENEETPSTEYFYNKTVNLKVMETPDGKNRIDFLRKGTRVTILEEETVGEKNPIEFSKIQYQKDNKILMGWINKSSLVSSLEETVPSKLGKLDFAPFKKQVYINNPKIDVKGIYVSLHALATPHMLDGLIELTKKSEINTFVVDVKNDDGILLFKMDEVAKYGLDSDKKATIKNIESVIKRLKDNNIYLIARIVSFKDPIYAKKHPERAIVDNRNGKPYSNSDGLIWVSAYDRELWKYNIAVAKEAAKVGFNEIQFDYVRFPASNGGKLDTHLNYRNTKNETKALAIQNFLKEARKELEPFEVYIAADVYGQVSSSPDDMALGQHWEAVSNVVDYICPMVYPSHYGNGVYGLAVPDAEPYKAVYGSTRDSINRNYNIDTPAGIRTWIQDFSAPWVKGHIKYGIKEVNEQIRALNDLGINEYILWNASNRYSFAKKQ
ncbi:MAG: putative glycoside hydrolase [Fusobacteriaceae bacterium]